MTEPGTMANAINQIHFRIIASQAQPKRTGDGQEEIQGTGIHSTGASE